MRLHAFYHVPFEDVGTIKPWAEARDHTLAASHLYVGDAPADPADYDLLVVMGGPMNIYEEEAHPFLAAEKRAIEAGIKAGRAVVGICLGAQLLADVLGGPVTRNAEPEIGWFPVTLTPQGLAEPAFAGFPETFVAFHWHGDTFATPPGAVPAATSEACTNQAFVYEHKVVGLQFHLETAPFGMQNLIKHCAADIVPGPHVQPVKAMHAARWQFQKIQPLMAALMDNLAAAVGA